MTAADLEAVAERVVELVAAGDPAAEANVLVTRDRHGLTRFANSFVHQNVTEDTTTVTLTVAVAGRSSTARTTVSDPEELAGFVSHNLESARLQPVDAHWPGATPEQPVNGTGNFDAAVADAQPDVRARGVKAFVDADTQLSAAGFFDTEATFSAFASSAGQRTSGSATRATVDGIHQTPTSAGSAHHTSWRIDDLDAGAAGARAAGRARRAADATDVDPGDFEVVLGPDAVATMLLFLSVYGFNAKSHLDGASFARLGEQQFDPQLTLLEDPTDERAIGLGFDAQGVARKRFALVEDGVTRALAHDRRTALRAGATSTGNALPGGESYGAIPTSVVLHPGRSSPEQMVAGIERGLLVHQFHYCRILDPKTQVVTGLTRNGTFLIEHGELAGAVGNLRFTQSFVDALADGNVADIGDDDRHADAEFGPGMVICPSLHLGSWRFTGGARG